MPDIRRRNCKGCRRPDVEVGAISWRGKCAACGKAFMDTNVDQMVARQGPNFDKWRRSMVLCAYPGLLDELDRSP